MEEKNHIKESLLGELHDEERLDEEKGILQQGSFDSYPDIKDRKRDKKFKKSPNLCLRIR